VRRWREEAPESVDAKRPSRAKASTAALARIACRRIFGNQRRALGHPAGAFGLQSAQAVCFEAVATLLQVALEKRTTRYPPTPYDDRKSAQAFGNTGDSGAPLRKRVRNCMKMLGLHACDKKQKS